jgi:hypothetical protein
MHPNPDGTVTLTICGPYGVVRIRCEPDPDNDCPTCGGLEYLEGEGGGRCYDCHLPDGR